MKRLSKLIDWNNRSLQVKLMAGFMLTLLFVLGVNAFMIINVNTTVNRLEQIYVSNLNLDGLLGSLGSVQDAMTEYLDTKSSDSLNKYYQAEQDFRNHLDLLNKKPVSDPMLLAEKNIYNLSLNYLSMVEDTINAKRGRDVEQYSLRYELASERKTDVETFIYSLNNARFKSNNDDYRVLLNSLKYMELVNIAILVMTAVFNLLLMNALIGNVTRPLRDLSVAAREVSEGNFDVVVEPTGSEDEIGILSKTFAQMLDSIKLYVVRIRESLQKENAMKENELLMESRMKDAQLKLLQAQINPHFLFNTLNAGAQLAMMEGADKTVVFIDNMASFFRYNIRKLDEDTTLGEELSLVDNYIYILNVRFSGEIRYTKTIDESLESVRVPSMILQPVVENAVNYGIRDLEGEKMIEVTCSRTESYVELSVWDNGKGMSRERIDEVLNGEYVSEHAASGGSGIGLGNVIGRLELYFGESGLLDIRSEGEGMGTEVVIRIPQAK